MDVIICDHHQPKEKLPPALCMLDPLKPTAIIPLSIYPVLVLL
jgi:single-stranded DNA-specific DHH superfamily exonuclease